MKALAKSQVSRLLSDQVQHEVLKHQTACLANLDELRSSGTKPDIPGELEAILFQPATDKIRRQTFDRRLRGDQIVNMSPLMSHKPLSSTTSKKITSHPFQNQHRTQIQRDDRNAQQRTALIKWLSPEPHDARYNALRMTKLAHDGDWLFKHPSFREWETGVMRTVLITGRGR